MKADPLSHYIFLLPDVGINANLCVPACVMVLCSVRVSYQAVDAYKLLWCLGPGWQLHIRDDSAVLHHSQVVCVGIDKHFWEVVELWNQLLHGYNTKTYLTLHKG